MFDGKPPREKSAAVSDTLSLNVLTVPDAKHNLVCLRLELENLVQINVNITDEAPDFPAASEASWGSWLELH